MTTNVKITFNRYEPLGRIPPESPIMPEEEQLYQETTKPLPEKLTYMALGSRLGYNLCVSAEVTEESIKSANKYLRDLHNHGFYLDKEIIKPYVLDENGEIKEIEF